MSDFPLYSSYDPSGQEKVLTLEEVFEDFLFDTCDDTNDKRSDDEREEDDEEVEDNNDDESGDGKKRSRKQQSQCMTEVQKKERRERNREHAKRSRIRRKFMMESLQQAVKILETENTKLKASLSLHLPAEVIEIAKDENSLIAGNDTEGNATLNNPDYSLIRALQTAQQNFVVSDPSLTDNPIVFASHGFLVLTGYSLDQVLGRNCRFLQGPKTDLRTIAKIGEAVKNGDDFTTVILNYRADGTPFWNHFFLAALRDGNGRIVNYLGVQCRVTETYAESFVLKEQEESRKTTRKKSSSSSAPLTKA